MVVMSESAREEAAIREVIRRLVDGWNGRDGQLFSSAFRAVHDYVAINGFQLLHQTREENASLHVQVWDTVYREGSEVSMDVTQIRFLSPSIALVHATSHNAFKANGTPRELDGSFTIVITKEEDNQWLISAFHNGNQEAEFMGHVTDR